MNARGTTMIQGRLWSSAAQDWAELQEPAAVPLWETMLDAAAVRAGTRLLDAGCGAGGASVLAAARGAVVSGLDAAEALLIIARARVPDGAFQCGDLEALPYADATFEAIIAADVLPYVADPLAVLHELRRVCAPLGRVVIALCAGQGGCGHQAIDSAVHGILPAPLGLAAPTLREPAIVEVLLARAGLAILGGGMVTCTYRYADREAAWQAVVSAGPLQAIARVTGSALLKAAVLHALVPFTLPMGAVCLENHIRYITAMP